jgi:hypothetical protein
MMSFNSMKVATSCRPATLVTCAAQRQAVGLLGTVAALSHRAVEPPRTVAIRHEWVVGLLYIIAALQPPAHASC